MLLRPKRWQAATEMLWRPLMHRGLRSSFLSPKLRNIEQLRGVEQQLNQ